MGESHETQPASANGAAGDDLEVIVVGGGQAGLAIGYFLARQGRKFAILEAAAEPAAAWRARWDSLKLFTPVRYSSLPGLPFPGDPGRATPAATTSCAYLTEYASAFRPPRGAGQPRPRDPAGRGIGTSSRSRTAATRPIRS